MQITQSQDRILYGKMGSVTRREKENEWPRKPGQGQKGLQKARKKARRWSQTGKQQTGKRRRRYRRQSQKQKQKPWLYGTKSGYIETSNQSLPHKLRSEGVSERANQLAQQSMRAKLGRVSSQILMSLFMAVLTHCAWQRGRGKSRDNGKLMMMYKEIKTWCSLRTKRTDWWCCSDVMLSSFA